jgi:hypothetical protein
MQMRRVQQPHKEGIMNFRVKALILAGTVLGAAALIPAVSEGRGGSAGGRGQCGQTQQQCRQQNPNCQQDRQRLRDGSCGNTACPQQGGGQRGPCPGPNGGSQGAGPKGGAEAPPVTN